MNKKIRIGTRDSELALWQANTVSKKLNDLGYKTEIVPVKSDKYNNLFAQATIDLRSKNVLTAEQSIDNINEYYAHMKHLYNLGEDYRRYILMPLDGDGETPYIINLNTRAITVPSTAVKLGAV